MIRCTQCGTQNPDGGGYCGGCGAALPVPAPGGGVHKLRVVPAGGGESRILQLEAGEWTVGRDPQCKLVLDDPFVSPQHAQLVAGPALHLTDLGSANGTWLRVRSPASLRAGDEMRMGRQRLRLEAVPAPAGATGGGRIWGSPSAGHRFRLVQLLEGGGSAEAMPMSDGDYLIGRDEGGMTFPGDLAISGRHAILTVSGEKASLRDLGSANGTFLRLRGDCDLQVGDHLLMGMQQIRYEAA
ncbi:MAG TPA: FHA domain-containing protein [Myxococcales bacterium]|nr:FHA domain-containing protein [Myxococcales bacterium]